MGVAAGLAHTVAYTDSGAVFAWGWNSDGQLGLGHDRNRSQPELLDAAVLEDVDVDKVRLMLCTHCTVYDLYMTVYMLALQHSEGTCTV